MKIYVAQDDELYAIWSSLEPALAYLLRGGYGRIVEYLSRETAFEETGELWFRWRCENCGNSYFSWERKPLMIEEYGSFCSDVCSQETSEFYTAGHFGARGYSTREAKTHIAALAGQALRSSACYCGTTERNRIQTVTRGLPVVHSIDCPNYIGKGT